MKKYVLIMLLMIANPMIGQEKEKTDYKRPVFGLNFGFGGGFFTEYSIGFGGISDQDSGGYINLSLTPEFYLGKKHKVYFYMQLPLYSQIFPAVSSLNQFGFGVLIGIGGYIIEADKYEPWSVVMNGAIGPALLWRFNDGRILYSGYASLYLSLDFRYHINNKYAIQFGVNGVLNATFLVNMGFGVNAQVGLAF